MQFSSDFICELITNELAKRGVFLQSDIGTIPSYCNPILLIRPVKLSHIMPLNLTTGQLLADCQAVICCSEILAHSREVRRKSKLKKDTSRYCVIKCRSKRASSLWCQFSAIPDSLSSFTTTLHMFRNYLDHYSSF